MSATMTVRNGGPSVLPGVGGVALFKLEFDSSFAADGEDLAATTGDLYKHFKRIRAMIPAGVSDKALARYKIDFKFTTDAVVDSADDVQAVCSQDRAATGDAQAVGGFADGATVDLHTYTMEVLVIGTLR